jgi:hypothetical protein
VFAGRFADRSLTTIGPQSGGRWTPLAPAEHRTSA